MFLFIDDGVAFVLLFDALCFFYDRSSSMLRLLLIV